MTANEKEQGRKPGRPRKFEDGRINATVRFTPERYADLKAEADLKRRSVSEEVEYRIEQYATVQDLLSSLNMAYDQIRDLQQQIATWKRDDDRLVERIEAAVARAMKGESR